MTSHYPPTSFYDALETNYQIPKLTFDVPSNRKVRVINIGTGLNSINNAYHIQNHCSNVELVMYERNASLGGTWLVNRYPMAACDVPSHVYQYSWAPNPDWPRQFS
jgi:cation diffusion facilitator CzcD-associated flavoprotein CzcO